MSPQREPREAIPAEREGPERERVGWHAASAAVGAGAPGPRTRMVEVRMSGSNSNRASSLPVPVSGIIYLKPWLQVYNPPNLRCVVLGCRGVLFRQVSFLIAPRFFYRRAPDFRKEQL